MPLFSKSELLSSLRIHRDGPSLSAELKLYVPVFGRSFPVSIQLVDGASEITDKTVQIVNEIAELTEGDRRRIRELLYADALRTAREVAFGAPEPYPEQRPSDFLRRLFWRPTKDRFVSLSQSDPRHPCHFEDGIDELEGKIEWLEFRINENEQVVGRFALLDCRPVWEEEHGVTIIIRNGTPVETGDYFVDLQSHDII